MGGGLESSCVGRVFGVDGAVRVARWSLQTASVKFIIVCRVSALY